MTTTTLERLIQNNGNEPIEDRYWYLQTHCIKTWAEMEKTREVNGLPPMFKDDELEAFGMKPCDGKECLEFPCWAIDVVRRNNNV